MNIRERWNDPEEMLRVAWDGFRAGLWTAMPGIVQSFDATKLTAVVQPAIQGVVLQQDGTSKFVNLPLLADVPVVFPHGGGCALTFPIAAGDECLVVFAARCIDAWWQSGGVQIPMEPRMQDLSDGFALIGPFSQATKLANVSASTVQLRSDDGSTYVELDPSGRIVNIVAPGGVNVTGDVSVTGKVTATGDVKAGTISLETHKHLGVTPGSGTSGLPTP